MGKDLQQFLNQLGQQSSLPEMPGIVFSLLVSALASISMYFIYEYFYGRKDTGSQIHLSFFLIGPSTTAIFIGIQFSLPLSLGLLGALSFIRFRTPIKDPEEIAYLMGVIALSIASATFNYLLVVLLLVMVVVLLILKERVLSVRFGESRRGHVLISAQRGSLATEDTTRVLADSLGRVELLSASRNEDVLTLHYTFRPNRSFDEAGLIRQLEGLDGVVRFEIMTGIVPV